MGESANPKAERYPTPESVAKACAVGAVSFGVGPQLLDSTLGTGSAAGWAIAVVFIMPVFGVPGYIIGYLIGKLAVVITGRSTMPRPYAIGMFVMSIVAALLLSSGISLTLRAERIRVSTPRVITSELQVVKSVYEGDPFAESRLTLKELHETVELDWNGNPITVELRNRGLHVIDERAQTVVWDSLSNYPRRQELDAVVVRLRTNEDAYLAVLVSVAREQPNFMLYICAPDGEVAYQELVKCPNYRPALRAVSLESGAQGVVIADAETILYSL